MFDSTLLVFFDNVAWYIFGFRYYSNYINYNRLVREHEKSAMEMMTPNTRAVTMTEEKKRVILMNPPNFL